MRKVLLAAVLVLVASGAQAVTLNVVDGVLYGASGVDVGGAFYAVEFLEGTCIDLFTGCDEASDFTFADGASATLAAQALLDQVLVVDPSSGINFDSTPALTNGCAASTIFLGACVALFPVAYPLVPVSSGHVMAHGATNFPCCTSYSDYISSAAIGIDQLAPPPQSPSGYTWAVWTPIPEPSTALLLGIGLAGMAARRRV